MAIDIEAVTDCIEAARTLVIPRFSGPAAGDVESKATPEDSDDVVAIVDDEVETSLSRALMAIDPAARVAGEEAARRRPESLDALASDQPLRIRGTIDGTKSFAAGDMAGCITAASAAASRTRSDLRRRGGQRHFHER